MTTYDADELELYIENTSEIYFGARAGVDRVLRRWRKRGRYDHKKAVQAWLNVAHDGATMYTQEIDPEARFPLDEKRKCARNLADAWLAEVEIEERNDAS